MLIDSHAHILEYGASRMMDLEGAKSIHGVQPYCQTYAQLMTSALHPDCVGAVRSFILSNQDVENDTSKFIEVSQSFLYQ